MTSFDNISVLLKRATKESDDPRVQVGAVITNANGDVVGLGSNRFPSEVTKQDIPNWPVKKHLYLNHAESEAILEALISGKELNFGEIYVNAFPCCDCAKKIIKVGLRRVHVINPLSLKFEWQESQNAARLLFKIKGVEVVE